MTTVTFGGGKVTVVCPRHGQWVFPHPSVEAEPFAWEHGHCKPVDPQLLRQATRPRKSRRPGQVTVVVAL